MNWRFYSKQMAALKVKYIELGGSANVWDRIFNFEVMRNPSLEQLARARSFTAELYANTWIFSYYGTVEEEFQAFLRATPHAYNYLAPAILPNGNIVHIPTFFGNAQAFLDRKIRIAYQYFFESFDSMYNLDAFWHWTMG